MIPFQLFTPVAQRAINLAKEEAKAHGEAGGRELLLGLLGVHESIACQALEALGVDLGQMCSLLLPTGEPLAGYLEAKSIFANAQELAHRSGAGRIGTQHLLMAIADNREGTASAALAGMGIDPVQLSRVIKQLEQDQREREA